MRLQNSNLTDGTLSLNSHGMEPLFNQAEVVITGTPSVVTSPVGKGIHFTDRDGVCYKFSVSEPWPCPFDINECTTGLVLSIWFRWEYVVSNYYRIYITLGGAFKVYRASTITSDVVSLRWYFNRKYSWFSSFRLVPGKWHLIMCMVNNTHSVSYLDGLKTKTLQKEVRNIGSVMTNDLHFNRNLDAGNFSVGQIQLWSGRRSPVFMWRLYQEGLPDDQK